LGYKVVGKEKKKGFSFGIEQKFWFSLIFTVPLFFGHLFFSDHSVITNPIVQLSICIPVFVLGFLHFGKSAFGSLKAGVPNMDVLIFIGSVASFGYSVSGMIMIKDPMEVHKYLFFETTATIISLVLLGNLMEHISVKKTTSAINELSALQPEIARRRIMKDGKESFEEIPADKLLVGDIVLVNGGESFPADGEVQSGTGAANEAMITGESLPVEKTTFSQVTGGTLLIGGPIRMMVKRVGTDTTLSHIISLVKKAQQDKPPVQQLADKISAIFVPVVLGISILTFLIAHFAFHHDLRDAMMQSIAVLVISCPCAMGLATPTAVMVGIGRSAKNGILIRGGRTLEQLARIKTVVFDKTGTLTTGNFSNLRITTYDSIDEKSVKEILFAFEQNSSHPLAKSIVALLKKENIQAAKGIKNVAEEKGIGLTGEDEAGNKWSVGSWRMLTEVNKENDIYLLKNGKKIAGISLEDEIREGMKELVSFLHSKNIHTILLSGDRKEKCDAVAKAVGISEVIAEQLPEEKLTIITNLSKKSKTAMVGDGINDAPALARADVGISPGEATQAAMQSAQVILLGQGDLARIKTALLIGEHSLKTIKQNLFWAFFYNTVAIPIAAFGLLTPIVAALAMAFSDVIVIGNSIRLRTKKLS
jgi:Cu+-exporting ATPase